MRRLIAFTALWVAAALVAVGVAWAGVSVVGDQVTDERPEPLAASEIRERLAETATSTTAPATPPATTPPPATAPPATAAAPDETRTYNLRGGNVALRFRPAGVTVVFANPAPGFTVEVEPEHVNGVKVEFESETHRSRVDGWWDGGPRDRVREDED